MFDQARLERLIAAYLDQELTAEEKCELEEMLLGSSKARKILLDRAELKRPCRVRHSLTEELLEDRCHVQEKARGNRASP